jgi:hypothetical protein
VAWPGVWAWLSGRPLVSGCSTEAFASRPSRCRGRQARIDCARPTVLSNRLRHAVSHGQFCGRCSVNRLAEEATRAGTETRARRRGPVVALVSFGSPVRRPAARVRLKAITRADQPRGVRRKRVRREMGDCGVLQVRVHLLDDGVLAVGFVGGDGTDLVGVGGGEERVEPPDVEQRALTLVLGRSQVGDTPHHHPTGNLVGLLLGGERGELRSRRPPPARSRCRCPRRRRRRGTRSASTRTRRRRSKRSPV